jgi:hypothetical protein
MAVETQAGIANKVKKSQKSATEQSQKRFKIT